MPYIYISTSDEKLIELFKNFGKASQQAFSGTESQRFKAILQAQDFRNKFQAHIVDTKGENRITLINQDLIDNDKNEESVIYRLAALLLDKPSLKSFVEHFKDNLASEMKALLKEIYNDIHDKGHVVFWMVSEEELDEIL